MSTQTPRQTARHTAWFASASLVLMTGHAALAQTAGTAKAEVDDGQVAEVVVTAQKRTENVQDIPKSVSVADQQQLANAGVTKLQDLSQLVPSLAGVTAGPGAPPPIRGISSFALSIGVQAQTGIVVDDVPQPTFSALANELTDVLRVEVLAGPQSTLSGRNAAGGLISIVTRSPTDIFHAQLNVEQTDDRQTRVNGFATGPISDTLGFSLSAFVNRWDGNLRNLGENNLRLGGWDTFGGRGKLRWKINDAFTATLTAYSMRSERLTPGLVAAGPFVAVDPTALFVFDAQGRSFSQLYPGVTPGPFNTAVSSPRHSVEKTFDRGATLRLEYDLGTVGTLTSLTNYSKANLPRTDNFLGTPTTGLVAPVTDPYAHVDFRTKYTTQEFRLTSPGDQAVTYLLGGIYSDTQTFEPYQRLGFFPVDWLRNVGIKSSALFGRATWQILPRDSVTGGLRYQSDKASYDWTFLPTTSPGPAPDFHAGGSKYDFWSGELSYKHDFTDDVNAYLTAARSETGQAYDLEDSASAASAAGLQPLASETVKNIEAGVKSRWFDRRLTLNLNAFLARYENYQIQSLQATNDPNVVPTIRLSAIGRVETKGVELTSNLRASNRLTLGVTAAYLDATIKDYPNAQCYDHQTAAQGCNTATGLQGNLAGSTMPNTPKFRYTVSANYVIALANAPFDLDLGAFYRHQTKARFDVYGSPASDVPGYGILNLSATLRDKEGRYTVTAFVNNALDKQYYASLADSPFFTAPAVTGGFARDSFRYAGVRVGLDF